jgi:hypothetical protein
MSETIVRSSPYRRSHSIMFVCLLETKSFVCCLFARWRCVLHSRIMRNALGIGLDLGGGGPKILPAVARMGTPQITWRFDWYYRSLLRKFHVKFLDPYPTLC